MYEKIVMDEEFAEMMKTIAQFRFTDNGKWDWEHGIAHALKVSRYVQRILISLNMDKRTVELGMIAGLLHDIGLISGKKENHAYRSSIYAEKYLQKFPMKAEERECIVQAISDHSNGKNIQSSVGAALLLADKLDISNHRVEGSSIQDEINTEFSKLYRVDIEIIDDYMYIFYKVQNDFKPSVFLNWDKALTIPYRVSSYFHKKCIFKMNHQDFDVESVVGKKICEQIC